MLAVFASMEARARRWDRIADKLNFYERTHVAFTDHWLADSFQSLGWTRWANGMRKITTISVSNAAADDEWLRDVCRHSVLEEFRARDSRFTAEGLAELARMDQLRLFHLEQSIADAHLEQIGRMESVEALTLCGGHIGDGTLNKLPGLSRVSSLSLFETQVRGWGLESLPRPDRLLSLRIHKSPLDNSSGGALFHCKNLVDIDVYDAPISDWGLFFLRSAALRRLSLIKTQVRGICFKSHEAFGSLADLNLMSSQVDDVGLQQIARLPRLSSLNIADTRVTPSGLSVLKTFPSLKRLCLSGDTITPEAVSHLAAIKTLQAVIVGTWKSKGHWDDLAHLRPDIAIELRILRSPTKATSLPP